MTQPTSLTLTIEGGEYFEQWAETAAEADVIDVADFLMSMMDLAAFGQYQHLDDVTHPMQFSFLVRRDPSLMTTVRLFLSDQKFTIIRIGPELD